MRRIIFICTIGILLLGCEDVIDVDVPQEEPRLIIDALFRVDRSEPFIPVEVRLKTTNNFFEELPTTSAESVVIFYDQYADGIIEFTGSSTLAETAPGSGIYIPDPNFTFDQRIPVVFLNDNVEFTIIVRHEGRQYLGQTRYQPAVPFDNLAQGAGTLFDEDETEVVLTYTDDPNRTNYYIFDFGFGEYFASEDTFYQGQPFSFSYFYDEKFEPGRELEISILGADQEFYNYMNLLVEQSTDDFNVFATPVATVRGNIFDITDLDNIDLFDNVEQPDVFPLGYFAIVEEYKATLTIQ